MTDPGHVLNDLYAHAAELDDLSKNLSEVERRLKVATDEYEEFMGAYEEGLWNRHVQDGEKFPAEALRARMGHRAMPPELLGKYTGLMSQRRRMEKRISALKAIVEAKRSVLSALKVEMEAVR
jgi:hypothetical protein